MTLAKSRCGVSSKKLLSWASMSGCISPNPGGRRGAERGTRTPGRSPHDSARRVGAGYAAAARPTRNLSLARCLAAYSPTAGLAARSRVVWLKIPYITDPRLLRYALRRVRGLAADSGAAGAILLHGV